MTKVLCIKFFSFVLLLTSFVFSKQADSYNTIYFSNSYQNTHIIPQLPLSNVAYQMNQNMHATMLAYLNSNQYRQDYLLAQEKKKEEEVKKQKLHEIEEKQYLHDFGVGKQCLYELFTKSFDELCDWICSATYLSKQQAINIWNEYCCNKRSGVWFLDTYKNVGREKIKQVYEQRELKKKEVKQEGVGLQEKNQHVYDVANRAFLIQQHEQVEDTCDWLELSDELYELRNRALEQAELESYVSYQKLYELDVQTCGYLDAKGITPHLYSQCFGTALQQQYHQEICDLFKQLAHQQLQLKRKAYVFDHACNFAQATHEANDKTWLSVAGVLSWTAQQLLAVGTDVFDRPLEYAQAIVSGVYESAVDGVHMLVRPDLAIYGFGQMIYFVLETGAMTDAAASYPCDQTQQVYQQRIDQINTTLSALQSEFAHLDGPGKVKAITKFGTDFYLPPKMIHACGHLLAGLCSRARGLRTLEGAAAMMSDELGLTGVLEEISCKAEQLELAVEQGLSKQATAEFMQAEKTVAGAVSSIPRPLRVLIEEVKNFRNGVIPSHCQELYKEFKSALKLLEKELQSLNLDKLKKLYEYKMIDDKQVRLAVDHLLNFKFKLVRRLEKGGYVLEITGGHLFGVCEALEKTGLVKIVSKKKLLNGVVDYVLENVLHKEEIKKTVFPVSWTETKLVKTAWEVYETGADFITEGQNIFKTKVIEGVNVSIPLKFKEIKINQQDIMSVKIATLLPYMPQGK